MDDRRGIDFRDAFGYPVLSSSGDCARIFRRKVRRFAPSCQKMDLVIVSGDRDFIPLVNVARLRHWEVEMAAFTSAYNPSGEMATSVERIVPLDAAFAKIGSHVYEWPIPTT